MRIQVYLLIVAFIHFGLLSAFGDIAPTEFVGSGIVPVPNSAVRMETAKVEIDWNSPCTLRAEFQMVNDTSTAEETTVGFPITEFRSEYGFPVEPDKITISFNGEAMEVSGPVEEDGIIANRYYWTWYLCKYSFPPGRTEVSISATLRPSRVKSLAYREAIRYSILSGGNWTGNIGFEEVCIKFPGRIDSELLMSATPADYQIDENEIRWAFKDIEPKSNEYDIEITYIRPDIMAVIRSMRQELARDPESEWQKVRLARHLLVLGPSWSNSGFPQELSSQQFEDIKNKITKRKRRKIFTRYYQRNDDGYFRAISNDWTDIRKAVEGILSDAGYRDKHSETGFVKEGEELLLEVLEQNEKNETAWEIYLVNYWRFSFAAVGKLWLGSDRFSKGQLAAIAKAAESCPNNKVIRLWVDCVENGASEESLEAIWDEMRASNAIAWEFPPVDYGYY